ncbi:MAG: cytochrome c oxidase assembly protein [Ktedonobacteraceae bacterium]|nr:cytochrome c oxidase assembly protein [Chloroflexota bacterium]
MTINDLNLTWAWSPVALGGIILLCALYVLGIWRGRRRNSQDMPLKAYQVAAFAVAILAMAFVLLTPVDSIARTQLFSVHMAQIVTLTTLCAPLLWIASPSWLLQPLLARTGIRRISQALTHPLVASLAFNLTFLIWHAPTLYHLALNHESLYHLEMLSLLFVALLNWWPLLGSLHELRRLSYPMQMLYVFLDGQPIDVFAFLLVFSGAVFYPWYAVPPQLHISAFNDQAVGGALLLLPGLVDLLVMSPLFFRWLAQVEERNRANDQRLHELAEAEEAARHNTPVS